MQVTLREAATADIKSIYEWRNNPEVRKWLFASEPIKWEDHLAFWQKRLRKKGVYSYVIECGGQGCGLARLDPDPRAEGTYLIDIYLDPAFQGKGVGTGALEELKKAAARIGIKKLIGSVKPENSASQKIFEANRFRLHHYEYEFSL